MPDVTLPDDADVTKNPFNSSPSVAGAGSFYAITPDDDEDLPRYVRAIRAPSDGNIEIVPVDPVPGANYEADPANSLIHPVKEGDIVVGWIKRVRAASTTVTGTIVGYT
jgi:hypothetical protein